MAVIDHAPLGHLRSNMHLTLHTHHAIRLWQGRMPAADLHGIFGLAGFVTVLNRIHRDAAQDDPYADAWLLRVEAKLDSTRAALLDLRAQLDSALSQAPAAMSLGDNLNQTPLHLPVTVNAPMAFLALYLLADYDELVRRALLAQHTALIDPPLLDDWLEKGAHQLRSLFSLVQPYRSSGVCRNDLLGPTDNALRVREAFGELPQAVLNRERRARHAPVIRTAGPESHRDLEAMQAEAFQKCTR
ncbi:integrating conjugative element protein, PFL_4669 family [Pseudomonas cedrina]|uniref:Integrating conjugative element protein n=2 Tax=Pseudomonas cedrina TaxID=651740 RepID=A0A1V2K1E9_PSECE|nr:TIGR03761 family integrating conjugative element protein [Pseudomonas cedrina]ONH50916.1 integrating conjugative element protein [Pseudomonas cedrina subsp. cedrina]SDS63429.1 integrating conjugative element protein, PFL_4669 family [Pseudomonas cedrina]